MLILCTAPPGSRTTPHYKPHTNFLQAAAFGMVECINNDTTREGGYSVRVGAKLFWLLFWMVEQGWVCIFAPLCAWAMCSECWAARGLGSAAIRLASCKHILASCGHF